MDGGRGQLVDGGRLAKSFIGRDDGFYNDEASRTFEKAKHWETYI